MADGRKTIQPTFSSGYHACTTFGLGDNETNIAVCTLKCIVCDYIS